MALDPEALKSSVPWYHAKLTAIDPRTRQLLEERGLPSEEVLDHVQAIRDKAWTIFPYPCIGMFSFTRLHLVNHPLYASTILPSLQSKHGTLLDLGCGFASDFRHLISVGVPSTSLTGLDNHDGFWNLGKDLFRDQETIKSRFVVADMTDLSSVPVDLLGKFDVVWAGASFHLFDWAGQVKASIVAATLLKNKKGGAVYGYQVGRKKGKKTSSGGSEVSSGGMYLHDPKTFEKLWEDVGREMGMEFEVRSWMDDKGLDDLKKKDPEIRRQRFAVVKADGSHAETEEVML